MSLPYNIKVVIERSLGEVQAATSVGGGDINRAVKFQTRQGVFFVKWNENAPEGMFETEAKGLRLLSSAGEVRVPDVAMQSEKMGETPAFLVLEWLELAQTKEGEGAMKLGRGLAAIHRNIAESHGLDHDNYIGSLPQRNTQSESWPRFYGEERIKPQMELAREKGVLSGELESLLMRLIEKLPQLVPDAEASLLHGDLWSGNWGVMKTGEPVVYDPAVYYGHREMDLAMAELFGGFGEGFLRGYNEVWTVDAEYEKRRGLYQLYPLMVHMNLFGGAYAGQVEGVAKGYVS